MTLYTLPAVRRKGLHLMLHQLDVPHLLNIVSIWRQRSVFLETEQQTKQVVENRALLIDLRFRDIKSPQSRSSRDQQDLVFFLRGQDRASKCWASSKSQSWIPEDHRRRSRRETLAPSKPRMVSSKQPRADNGTASLKVRRSQVPLSLSTSGDRSFL